MGYIIQEGGRKWLPEGMGVRLLIADHIRNSKEGEALKSEDVFITRWTGRSDIFIYVIFYKILKNNFKNN